MTSKPVSEREKQLTPLKGEVKLEEARSKAIIFAAQAKEKMKRKGAEFK